MMKKCAIMLFASLAFLVAKAQHIHFSGIPLAGKIIDFTEEMRKKGFNLQKKMVDEDYYIFRGKYNGTTSYMRVNYTPKSNTVYSVIVTPQRIDMNMYLDSLIANWGAEYTASNVGYQWKANGGVVIFVTPEGKDPILIINDLEGSSLYKKEKEQ